MKFWLCLMSMLACAKISTGLGAQTNASNPGGATATNAPAPSKGPAFTVRRYRVEGNTVLWQEKIHALLAPYTGEAVDIARIRQGLGELQLLYRQLGFATVSVTLPQQRITNGIVRVQVIEGRLTDIAVTGNRYFSSNNVLRALPGLTTNELLNSKWFQPELDRANGNPDRQIYPVINPGPDPGTSGITLQVKDRFPLHGHVEVNDKSTPGTPLLRIDSALQYNNLWQLEHQIGLQYNFSPQSMKSDQYSPNIFDQPSVASYSGFYRIPIAFWESLRETYQDAPVDFGYDQVSHRFVLPPPSGNPELIAYASRSTTETPVRLGPLTVITNTVLEDLSSQFAERDLTTTENLGARLTVPFDEFAGIRSAFSLAADYKWYQAQSYTTNLTFASLYALDQFGNRVLVTNQTLRLAANSSRPVYYLPLSAGWSASRADPWGNTTLSFNPSLTLASLSSSRMNFEILAGSRRAGGNYWEVTSGMVREQRLPKDWSLLVRANGQFSSAPLISNEQFALGGTAGVRGYQEGANYADTGWRVLCDLRAPAVNVGYFPDPEGDIPANLRCSWFMDYGEAFLLARPEATAPRVEQWGTGLGFYLTAGAHVDARLTLGWALRDAPGTRVGSAQAYFSVGFQF